MPQVTCSSVELRGLGLRCGRAQLFSVGLIVLVVGLAGAGPGGAAPPNVNMANAIVLTASGGSLTTDNSGATTEPGEPDKAGDRGGASLWYSWTPDFDGVATIDTSGSSVDTLLGAFVDWPGGAFSLSRVASNDDIGDSDTTSRVCTYVSANTTTFRIAVDGYDAATGPITLHWGKKTDSAPCPMIPPNVGGPSQPKVGDQLFLGAANFVDGGGSESIQWLRC